MGFERELADAILLSLHSQIINRMKLFWNISFSTPKERKKKCKTYLISTVFCFYESLLRFVMIN